MAHRWGISVQFKVYRRIIDTAVLRFISHYHLDESMHILHWFDILWHFVIYKINSVNDKNFIRVLWHWRLTIFTTTLRKISLTLRRRVMLGALHFLSLSLHFTALNIVELAIVAEIYKNNLPLALVRIVLYCNQKEKMLSFSSVFPIHCDCNVHNG